MDDELAITWRSPLRDFPIRLMIMRKAIEIFEQTRLPCEPEFVEESLDMLVPNLEATLYRTAHSLEEYGDKNTVQQRLESLAPHHEHLQPLQALWLQELFSLSNSPTDSSRTNVESEPTVVEDNPAEMMTQPMFTTPPAIPTQDLRSRASTSASIVDDYTRSLLEVRELLNAYDATTHRRPPPRQNSQFPLRLPSDRTRRRRRNEAVVDLKCHELPEDELRDL